MSQSSCEVLPYLVFVLCGCRLFIFRSSFISVAVYYLAAVFRSIRRLRARRIDRWLFRCFWTT
jgi:hypothetical protein